MLAIQQIHGETIGTFSHLIPESGVVPQARSGQFTVIVETNQAVDIKETMPSATVDSERSTDLRLTVLGKREAPNLSVLGRVH